MACWRVQTQTRAHTALPFATLFRPHFELINYRAEGLSTQLSHLKVEQRRHDRDKRDYEDSYQPEPLLSYLHRDAAA